MHKDELDEIRALAIDLIRKDRSKGPVKRWGERLAYLIGPLLTTALLLRLL